MLFICLFKVSEGAFAHLKVQMQTVSLFSQLAQTLLQLGDLSGALLCVRLELGKSQPHFVRI